MSVCGCLHGEPLDSVVWKLKSKKEFKCNSNPTEPHIVYMCFVDLMSSAKLLVIDQVCMFTLVIWVHFYVPSLRVSSSMSAWCTDVSVGQFYHCSIYSHFQVLLMSEPQLPEAPCKHEQIKYPNMNHKTWLMFRQLKFFSQIRLDRTLSDSANMSQELF